MHTLFYLISYIYTHTQQKEEFSISIKIMFDANFHKLKFIFTIFIVKFLKSFILNTNDQIYTKVSKKSFNWTNKIFKIMNDPKHGGISYASNIFEVIML